jgi:hypothetical protein
VSGKKKHAVAAGLVGDIAAIDDVADWIDAGGPGAAEPPAVLDLYGFKPSRHVRDEAGFGETTPR